MVQKSCLVPCIPFDYSIGVSKGSSVVNEHTACIEVIAQGQHSTDTIICVGASISHSAVALCI